MTFVSIAARSHCHCSPPPPPPPPPPQHGARESGSRTQAANAPAYVPSAQPPATLLPTGKPEKVAKLIIYLSSKDKAAFITGSRVLVSADEHTLSVAASSPLAPAASSSQQQARPTKTTMTTSAATAAAKRTIDEEEAGEQSEVGRPETEPTRRPSD